MKKYITEIKASPSAVAVEDTVLMAGVPATAGSKMLEKFVPLHDAEVVSRLKKSGYDVAGKVNVGEFGLDLLGETSYFGCMKDENGKLISASAAVAKEVKGVLSVDLNGAPRRGAALSDVLFVKPTYGTVSRYGVIPCACSAEQVGVFSAKAEDAASILSAVSGHDAKDGTSLPVQKYEYNANGSVKGLKVCVLKDYVDKADDEMKAFIDKAVSKLAEGGAEISYESSNMADAVGSAWFAMMCAESCNNISRYDGVKFGFRAEGYKNIDELYTKSRSEAFGLLTKTVVLYGSDVLSKNRYFSCYDKALRVRRKAKEFLDGIFAKYDMILIPPCSKSSYESATCETVYAETVFTALASIAGVPAATCNGVQLVADRFNENKLLSAAAHIRGEV